MVAEGVVVDLEAEVVLPLLPIATKVLVGEVVALARQVVQEVKLESRSILVKLLMRA